MELFLGFSPTDLEIDKMLQTLDPNGIGKLHYGDVSSFLTSQVDLLLRKRVVKS